MASRIQTKRIYEAASKDDGVRVLVDRIWPRGIRKADAALDHWIKDVAPSTSLRKWFGHRPERWAEFTKRYGRELDESPEAVAEIRELLKGRVTTLLYAAHDTEHNNAIALREYLVSHRSKAARQPVERP